MSLPLIGLYGLLVLFILLFAGVPIWAGLALVGIAGYAVLSNWAAAFGQAMLSPFSNLTGHSLTVLPLFILMADVCFFAGFSRNLFVMTYKWMGHLPGGLCAAAIAACALFGAVSASLVATSITIGLVSIPEMRKYGYDPSLACGSIAAGGTLGVLIPPSALLIIYGVMAEQSIGKLFIAGIVPGIVLCLMWMIMVFIWARANPKIAPAGPKASWGERFKSIAGSVEILLLIALTIGGLIIGWFTPTEAGAVGAGGAIVLSLARRRLTWPVFKQAIMDTIKTSGMLYLMLIGAFLFNLFITGSNIPFLLADKLESLPLSPSGVMLAMLFLFLILGCVMDTAALLLIIVPVFLPVTLAAGYDLIWWGVFLVLTSGMGTITPPVGIAVFAIAGITPDIPMRTIFKGIFPFLYIEIAFTIILIFFQPLATWLPNLIW